MLEILIYPVLWFGTFFDASVVQIPRESNYYVQARIKLADVYLKHQHNRVLYSKCYTEITQLHPNAKVEIITWICIFFKRLSYFMLF